MDTSSLLLDIWQEVNPFNMASLHWAVQPIEDLLCTTISIELDVEKPTKQPVMAYSSLHLFKYYN